jgi:hypothetical protein
LTVLPAAAEAPEASASSSAVSQPASGWQSSSVNATNSPDASAAPRLRARAGPALPCRSIVTVSPSAAATASSSEHVPPSSTTTTSNRSRG